MRVLIVGAGLAGLATSLALTSKNEDVQVVIVERRPNFESRGATFGLAKNGQASLEEIAPKVCTKLVEIGLFIPQSGAFMLPWWVVRDALLEEVRSREDRIAIHMGVSMDAVTESGIDEPMIVTFEGSDMIVEADMVIGADGVHSHVRQNILKLPPARPSNAFVWRGSIDMNASESLRQFKDYPLAKMDKFGDTISLAYFNFQPKVEGKLAWVTTVRMAEEPNSHNISSKSGKTTPLDVIESYMKSVDTPGEDLLQKYENAKLLLGNTHQPSDLTFSTEMCVVDLDQDHGWGGEGRITLIGDAAHSVRPVSGLGGSLAFEDAALLYRALLDVDEDGDRDSSTLGRRLRGFEAKRLPRCRSISRDQSIRSSLSYKVNYGDIPRWNPLYEEWIWAGPDAPPEPPVCESEVFGNLLKLI
mmetsp:Transcript_11633/g.20966  ORF Transcript_11633/g.20966 Transcript_11633/m.20966 type:complete len:416 (+) Transcript_11633:53-1300(+)|eukprot:CAMPEP_0201604318 /NCGR_PEP_ID=MMETSP0492-20130828/4502_1 /ASSEMBLY_ACC=CAM_ASM_000837 /TAXON_ID=420259 /ORGANISM="Thalassiosira gravida, Strain GMp14c1" /LENGTH=415 /DNA_ID=CAMNT_0048068329 /DNA_START=39 /DNA_END=1286 /DNA_ORIENTATION=-